MLRSGLSLRSRPCHRFRHCFSCHRRQPRDRRPRNPGDLESGCRRRAASPAASVLAPRLFHFSTSGTRLTETAQPCGFEPGRKPPMGRHAGADQRVCAMSRHKVNVRLPTELNEHLSELADEHCMSRNALAVMAIRNLIGCAARFRRLPGTHQLPKKPVSRVSRAPTAKPSQP